MDDGEDYGDENVGDYLQDGDHGMLLRHRIGPDILTGLNTIIENGADGFTQFDDGEVDVREGTFVILVLRPLRVRPLVMDCSRNNCHQIFDVCNVVLKQLHVLGIKID